MDSTSARYPKATVDEILQEVEGGRTLYEVRLSGGGGKVDLKLDEAGKLVAEERPVAREAVPTKVFHTLSVSKYGHWTIKQIEEVDNLERPELSGYEFRVSRKAKERELLFSKEGRLLSDEEGS
jgi:hypothetical protein